MAYVRVDDDFDDHAKVLLIARPLRNAAIGMYLRGLCYACRHESDGFLPRGKFDDPGDSDVVEALVSVELWEQCDGGYRVHDYLSWNRSADEIERIRKVRREAGSRGGKAKASKLPSKLVSMSDGSASVATYPTTETETETVVQDLTRAENEKPKNLSNFPPCFDRKVAFMVGDKPGPMKTCHAHVLSSVDAKHAGSWSQADLGMLATSLTIGCPKDCDGSRAFDCCKSTIEKIEKAHTLKTAAEWLRKDARC